MICDIETYLLFLGQRDIIGLDEQQNRLLFLDAEDDLDEILILHKSLLKRYFESIHGYHNLIYCLFQSAFAEQIQF